MRSALRAFPHQRSVRAALLLRFAFILVLAAFSMAGCDERGKAVPVDLSRREEPTREEPPQAITYAYLPQYSHRVSLERHHLLVEYLQKTTGLPIRQVFPDTFDEHVKMVGRGKIDISFVNPFVYVRMHQLFQAEAFAKVLEYPPGRKQAPGGTLPSPEASFRGQIIVRADNTNIKSLKDCLGKRWIAVDPTSAGGYLYPLGLFHSQGITSSDFSEIAFAPGPGGKQEKVVMAVLAGKYDLGSIREGTLDVITGSADVHNITVLANTPYYPGWVYSARKGLDPNVLEKIRTALLALDPGKPSDLLILEKADFAGVVAATDKDFDQVRELVSTIGPELQ